MMLRSQFEILDLLSDVELVALLDSELSGLTLDAGEEKPPTNARDYVEWVRRQLCDPSAVRAWISDLHESTVNDAVVVAPSVIAIVGEERLGLAAAVTMVLARRGLRSICLG